MKKKIITLLFLMISVIILTGCGENDESSPKLAGDYKKIYREAPSKISQKKIASKPAKGIEIDEEKLGGLLSDKYISGAKIVDVDIYSVAYAKTDQKPQKKIKVFNPIIRTNTTEKKEEKGFTVNTHGQEGYIEQLGITGRSTEGYMENTGGQSHKIAGYVEAMGSQSHGTEGYVESTGGQNHQIAGYVEAMGSQSHGSDGYIESLGAQSHGSDGYIESLGAQSHEIDGYIEATGTQNHETSGYIESLGAQSHGSDGYTSSTGKQTHSQGYIETLGITHNWTDELINEIWSYWNLDGLFMQALLGEDEYIQGYTHKLGITGREEEQGYVEKTGAVNHGTEGYIENFHY